MLSTSWFRPIRLGQRLSLGGELLSLDNTLHVGAQLVDGLDVLIVLIRVVDDTAT